MLATDCACECSGSLPWVPLLCSMACTFMPEGNFCLSACSFSPFSRGRCAQQSSSTRYLKLRQAAHQAQQKQSKDKDAELTVEQLKTAE